MGASSSKMEDDKALLLCRERKRLVRQALDGRCSLASAHVSYIQSLRNIGTALRKFSEPDTPTESSLYTSTSETPEPLALVDKSTSQFSNSSPSFSQGMDTVDSSSPVPSPLSSARFHVDHMKSIRIFSKTFKEKSPTSVIATLETEATTPKGIVPQTDDKSTAETPPTPGTRPWDFFELSHPIENQLSFQDGTGLNLDLDNADDIKRLREEEGIPELEEKGENSSTNGRDNFVESEDDFDQSPAEPLVRMFQNRNQVLESNPIEESSTNLSLRKLDLEIEQRNGVKPVASNGMCETDESVSMTPPKAISSVLVVPNSGHENGHDYAKIASKDFMSCMCEIEDLFLEASDCGKEVSRKLEADRVYVRPLFSENKACRSNQFTALTSCFGCCTEVHLPEEPAPNEMKYLTWHRSASSLSSSSRNLIGVTSKDEVGGSNDVIFGSICMNAGSHASTLDRLYAWERKLYDEVKASGIIRRDYDMKCRMLRHQESRGESPYKIDKTRATVKDLHSRINVAIHRINSISTKIEELRDKELQQQLEELIKELIQMWKKMLDCHQRQYHIVSLTFNNGSAKISIRSESHRQATILLEFELNSLCSSFTNWISAHKSYLESINGWLLKCVFLLRHKSSRRKRNDVEFCPKRDKAPPIFVICQDWLKILNTLPVTEVEDAIKNLVTITTSYLPRQEKAHGSTHIQFSLSRKAGKTKVLENNIQKNEAPVDLNLNIENLQSGLVVLFDQLKTFAENSVEKYGDLQKAISAACDDYK